VRRFNDASDGLYNFIIDTSNRIVNNFNDASDGLYKLILDTSDDIVHHFNDVSTLIVRRFNDASDGLFHLIMDTSNMIIHRLNDVSDGIVKNFNDTSDGIVKRFNDASDGLYALIKDLSTRHNEDNTLMQSYINTEIGKVTDSLNTEVIQINKNIGTIDKKYEGKFKTLYENDIADINSSITNIRKEFVTADYNSSTQIYNYLKETYKKELTGEISKVDSKLTNYITSNDKKVSDLDTKINSVNSDITTLINSSYNEINGYINDISTRLDKTDKRLDDRITEINNTLTNSIQTKHDTLDGRITKVDTDLKESIKSKYDLVDGRITTVNENIIKRIDQYNTSLADYTDQEIKTVNNAINKVKSDLTQEITNNVTNIDSSITRIDNYLERGYWTKVTNYVGGEITKVDEKITNLKSEINNSLSKDYVTNASLNDYYNNTIKKYVDEQDALYNTSVIDISNRLKTTNDNIKSLNDKLTALTSDNIDGTINTYKEVQDFLNSISDTTTLVTLLANNKNQAIESANQYTDSSINNFKNTYVKPKFDNYDNSISTINGDIKNINGKITTNQTDITNLTTRVNKAETDIKNIDGNISTITTDINKLKDFQTTVNNKNYLTEITVANDNKLGGIKTGYTPTGANASKQLPVTLNSDGRAYVTLTNSAVTGAYTYTLPTANNSELGGIKTGYTNNGNKVKVEVDGSGNAYVALTETAVKGGFTYTLPTAGTTTLGGICTGYTNSGSNIKVQMSGNNAYVGITKDAIVSALSYTPAKGNSDGSNTYTLPKATGSTLGGIQVGFTQSTSGSTLNLPVKLDSNGNAYISINLTDL